MTTDKLFLELLAKADRFKSEMADARNSIIKTQQKADVLKLSVTGLFAGVSFAAIGMEFSKAFKAFEEQEVAINKLNAALGANRLNVEKLSKKYQDIATELQGVTNIGDEVLINASAVLQRYIGDIELSKKQIKAFVDFAVAQNMDLESAFKLIGKTLSSSTNALGRYGIEIDTSASKSEKLAQITEILSSKFEGAASSAVTLGQQVSNAWGDIYEMIGGKIAPLVERVQLGLLQTAYLVQSIGEEFEEKGVWKFNITDAVINNWQGSVDRAAKDYMAVQKARQGMIAGAGDFVGGGNGDNKAAEKAYNAAIKMLQAQSAKEIATTNATNIHILWLKERLEKDKLAIMNKYGKQGTADYIAQEARLAEASRAIDLELLKDAERRLDNSLAKRLAMSDLSRLQELEAIRENEEKKLLLYEKGTQAYIDQQQKVIDANNRVMAAMLDEHKKTQEQIKMTAETFSGGIASTLRGLAEGTISFGNLFKKIMLDIAEAQLNSGLSNIFTNLLTPTTKDTGITGTSAGISHGNTIGNILKGFAGVFNKLPSFDSGGIVPGAFMQPQLAIVHGQEKVLRPWDAGYNSSGSQGSSEPPVFVYAPQVETAANAQEVFNVLEKHKDAFFAFIKQNKKRYPGVF